MCNFKIKESLWYKKLPACTFTVSTSNFQKGFKQQQQVTLVHYMSEKITNNIKMKNSVNSAFIAQDKISHSAQLKENKLTT